MNPVFRIEQVAIAPKNPKAAIELLSEMGIINPEGWIYDVASGRGAIAHWDESEPSGPIYDFKEIVGSLAFNYDLLAGKEFEVLEYGESQDNWLLHNGGLNSVSHFGMHCEEEELDYWIEFFKIRNIPIAQRVRTESHTNLSIQGKREYEYVIFDTREIIGVDIKLIVRHIIG